MKYRPYNGTLNYRWLAWLILMSIHCNHSKPPHPGLVKGWNPGNLHNSPGYALLITLKDSVLLEENTGVEDLNTQKPISKNSLFNVGSISKTFVAYGILNLALDGKLNLQDSLNKFFPNFKNRDIGNKVRIFHLLTHSSGLPDIRPVQRDSIFFLTADDAQNWAPILENDSLNFEPGTRYQYSNPAFNALALIIQQVTGLKWQDYIKIKIFTPCRMATSTITDGPHPDQGVCHAYLPLPDSSWKEQDFGEEPTFNAAGNGGVWSSVYELSLYEQGIKNLSFFTPEVLELGRKIWPLPQWSDKSPSKLGLSWVIEQYEGHTMYSHTGSQGGFTGDFVSIPDIGFFYTILSNTPVQIEATRNNVLEYALKQGWITPFR